MKTLRPHKKIGKSTLVLTLVLGTASQADVGPSVEIKMPVESPQAVSGEEYVGKFLVRVGAAGTLSDFKFLGEGWDVVSFTPPPAPIDVQPGVIEIPFRAIPQDAQVPVGLSLAFNGCVVRQTYEIGPEAFARRQESSSVLRVLSNGQIEAFTGGAGSESGQDDTATTEEGSTASGTLRVTGRIVYQRPDGEWVGAAWLDVEVWDNDDIGHDDIWTGYTDAHGYFDTGVVTPEDDPDGPDLILFFETETAVVDVTDNSIYESTYEWETDEIEDYTGSTYNYGTLTVSTELMPALNIFSSITRAHRIIRDFTDFGGGGLVTPKVQVEWPDNSRGDTKAWYEYYSDLSEIHLSTGRNWMEDTHTHEYGHHFMHMYSFDPPDPDYCNDPGPGFCDYGTGVPNCYDTASESCGHCMWCRETDHDAWNEGWPNWLADVVTRAYPAYFQFDDGSPYESFSTRSNELTSMCCQDGAFHDPFLTEGFPGALLRDIEDDTQDDQDGDGIWDSLCVGPKPIFDIQVNADPRTVGEFISVFKSWYPEHAALLYPTAFNVAPAYVNGYAPDSDLPGVVPDGDSPTHPIGVGGPLPCIEVEWSHAPDGGWGTCAYSYEWTTNPVGVEPDLTADPTGTSGCNVTTGVFATPGLGTWYLSVKARDCAVHWSYDWVTLGPFEVTDCDGSGVNDVCDTSCSHLGIPEVCEFSPGWCNFSGCGTAPDCNGNASPDSCDIASGESEDCNLSGIPDECENMFHWADGSGNWGTPGNWEENQAPTSGAEVCIDVAGDQTVTYSGGASDVGTFACSESLDLAGGTVPWAELTIADASWVDGILGLSGNGSVLQVDDRLDIGGMFTWTGSNVTISARLRGPGVTYANGGTHISQVVHLDQHHLILDGNSSSVTSDGRVDFIGPAVFEIRPGSTYEHQGDGYIFNGWFDDSFENAGTLIKSVDSGTSWIYMFTNNSGLIHVKTGRLKMYLRSSSAGDFLVDPGAVIEFNGGGHEFLAGSSIVAQNIEFTGGVSGVNDIYGTYNVSDSTKVLGGHTLTFHPSATVIDYGTDLTIAGGPVNFDYVFGAPVNFNSVTVTGVANFNSGDPIHATTLRLGPGTVQGASDITISGLTTWNASGHFRGPGTIHANGDVVVGPGGGEKTLRTVFNNAASMTMIGQFSINAEGVFNNLASGVMDVQKDGGVIQGLQTQFNNAGTLVKTAGSGTGTISAPTTNTGTVEIQTGELEFYTHYSGFYTQTAGQTKLNGGDLSMFGPAPVRIDGGVLTGYGTITGNVVNTGGTVQPGLSAGRLDVTGTYSQGATASLEVELAGSRDGEYDVLACSGAVSLAGGLEVELINGFAPEHGDRFPIVLGSSVTGEFDPVNIVNLPPKTQMIVYYSPTTVALIVPPVDGDCDEDYVVGLGDLAEFVPCLAGPEGGLGQDCDCADMSGDGDVDLGDLALFQVNFTGPLP